MHDLNCDMGEGIGHDENIMPYISSANIACGFHAGNGETIRRTIELALQHGVKIGAHPSFHNKENFGRKEMQLPADKVYAIVLEQLIKIDLIAKARGVTLHHVKPHGALYNMAAHDQQLAHTIATVVKDFDENLVLYGLSGSYLISEAKKLDLRTANEVFADRTYTKDGLLTPRTDVDALIENEEDCVRQVRQLVLENKVTTTSLTTVDLIADTICIHGDGKHAVKFAKAINSLLKQIPIKNYPYD